MASTVLSDRRSLNTKRRLDALLELVAGYFILLCINVLWFESSLGWIDTVMHPYFVVVLLISARYGTIDGIAAGLVGAGLHMFFQVEADPDRFAQAGSLADLTFMATPYLLILVGTLVGEVRQVAEDEIIGLWKRVKALRSDLSTMSDETRQVKQYNEDLQERIASSTQTTGAFYEVAAQVQTLREAEALPAILEVVNRFVGATKCALYVRGPENWDLRIQRGWADPNEYPRTIAPGNPMMVQVEDGKLVTLRDSGAVDDDTSIVLAAPVYRTDQSGNSTVFGALTIQTIPLGSMNLGTVRNLEGVAQWASRVLSSAETFERVRERDPADAITGTYRYPYLLRRLEEECARWRRYHIPGSLLLIRIVNYERVPKVKRAAFLRRVGRMAMKNVRQVDLAARWKSADTLALLLPSTDAGGARVLAGRINDQFSRDIMADVPRSAELALRFGLGSMGEHGDRREELVRAAEKMELS